MTRRSRALLEREGRALMVAVLLTFGLVPTLASSSSNAQTAPDERPNFLVILTDDQRWDTIGRCSGGAGFDGNDLAAGNSSCMPHLQRLLVANGMTFKKAYATTSLCCPSRASILTGQYARHTGVLTNFGFPFFDDSSTLATWLDDAGYRTGLVGKYLNGYGEPCCVTPANYVPPGWDTWHGIWGRPDYLNYSLVHKDEGAAATTTAYSGTNASPVACANVVYSTDKLCHHALNFLRANTTDPFFLYFSPFSPHESAMPPSRWGTIYTQNNQPVVLPQYPNYNQIPSPNPPSWLARNPLSAETLRLLQPYFFRALRTNRGVDDTVDAFVRQLESDGRLDNTVIVFMSDNGFARGEHRYDNKACEYEECHKVPLVIACGDGVCPGGVDGRIDADTFALNIDLAPTFLDLAGIEPPLRQDGESLAPLLNGGPAPERDYFLIEEHGLDGRNNPLGIVMRAADGHVYKYVKFLHVRFAHEREMYDLTTDPWELNNLVGDGVHGDIEAALVAQLDRAFNPPVVSIGSGPSGDVASNDVEFGFSSTEAATFECSLDGAAFSVCGSGTVGTKEYSGVSLGAHSFRVRGVDGDNNVGASVSREFNVTVEATASPTVTSSPSATPSVTASPSASSTPTASPTATPTPTPTATPTATPTPTPTPTATGAAPSPPVLTLTPPALSPAHAAFHFTGDAATSSFSCSIDGGDFAECDSPESYSLANGSHTFAVRAHGDGGVSDPVSYTWTVDATPPVVTMQGANDTLLTARNARAAWTGSDANGPVTYDVYERIGYSGSQTVVATNTTATDFQRNGELGTTYCYQVVGYDRAGNASMSAERCVGTPQDDRHASFGYLGATAQVAANGAFNSTLTVLDGPGESLRFTFTGRRFGVMIRRTPTSGFADLMVDGSLVRRVDLYSPTVGEKIFLDQVNVTPGPHTVDVVWTGIRNPSATGSVINVDGVTTISP